MCWLVLLFSQKYSIIKKALNCFLSKHNHGVIMGRMGLLRGSSYLLIAGMMFSSCTIAQWQTPYPYIGLGVFSTTTSDDDNDSDMDPMSSIASSSSTSSTSSDDSSSKEAVASRFFQENHALIAEEAAQGHGEHLHALAILKGCRDEGVANLGQVVHAEYETVFAEDGNKVVNDRVNFLIAHEARLAGTWCLGM